MHNKQADLEKYRNEIKSLLRNEIVSRYYAQKGRVEAAVTEDQEIKKAIEVLGNQQTYKTILSGTDITSKSKS